MQSWFFVAAAKSIAVRGGSCQSLRFTSEGDRNQTKPELTKPELTKPLGMGGGLWAKGSWGERCRGRGERVTAGGVEDGGDGEVWWVEGCGGWVIQSSAWTVIATNHKHVVETVATIFKFFECPCTCEGCGG